ncbi:diguanylate phosphodiesterase [Erythrobacter sp. QSSC1-22B]|uniref:putative bifunctional diguanylate cyclase/phosphodiesterase n=1 Tax=Erythrobacter sp. QSSC1-22B TaxID=1860125 RepID=UPI00080533C0|nr:sensor domain-containing phosphodiesterase [Erythrobacter sp. QSSC1-22B]OBX18042.1 diguanylate phosphodiesterase [Erythrobacter sp. QSSC1-22B]
MKTFDESGRLDALRRLNLLDTPPSESFDRITRMASQIFDLPIAAVSLTDSDRQWFKSRVGVAHTSIPRDAAPCAAVAESTETIVVPDLLQDPRYANSVLASQGVRFYAGAPLTTREGFGLGALCVLGMEPKTATASQMAALTDLAQMVMAQIELQHAFGRVDPISGLANRVQFFDDLDDLGRDDPGRTRQVVLVELAGHEQLTEGIRVLGSDYVDTMVQEAARTLRKLLGARRPAYHVAATQFAFLAPLDTDQQAYMAQLAGMLGLLRTDGTFRFVTNAKIGVAPFVTGESSPADVLRTAYSAALDARFSQTGIGIYALAEDNAHRRRFLLLEEFGAALEDPEQLRLVYQPRVDLATRRCVGAEALLRWTHPRLGEISPAEFIPIIEKTSLARSTTASVIEMGLGQLGAWRKQGMDINLSINISATNLSETDFAQRIQLYLLKHGVRPEMLELEVTESAVMEDTSRAIEQLVTFDEAGIGIAIDDFGTGHSSLAYLQRLPAKIVKIDQSFVRDMMLGKRERTLVRSMISLSHELGYCVVAEGIETSATGDLLTAMGCDEGQGYYFAHPMEAADFERWFAGESLVHAAA